MKARRVELGQIWRSVKNGENWLVTKTYSESFASYAIIRKVEGTEAEIRRVRVTNTAEGPALAGYVLVEGSS